MDTRPPFWSIAAHDLLNQVGTTAEGLSSEAARDRVVRYGPNLLTPKRRSYALTLLLAQFKSPIILILVFAAVLSFFLHDPADALIILTIILASGVLPVSVYSSIFPGRSVATEATETERRICGVGAG